MLSKQTKLPISKDRFISIIGGTQAGIATTAAIIAGLVIGTSDRNLVFISAIVAVFVQAYNSSVTNFLTAHMVDEIEKNKERDNLLEPLAEAALQFSAHILAGALVILPIIYVQDLALAMLLSLASALVMLLWIGLTIGHIVHHTPLRIGIQAVVTGSLVISGGLIAGSLIS